MYSTLLTLAIKGHAEVNSSLFSSKYFHFYNVKVVTKASSNFPQHHMILTCPTLCKPLIPLVSHISALLFKQVPRFALFKIVFFPPSHPTGSFVSFNRYVLVWLFCLIVCCITLFILLPPLKKKQLDIKLNPRCLYILLFLLTFWWQGSGLHFTPQYVG